LVPTDLVILGFQSIQISGQSKKAYEPILVVFEGIVIDVSAVPKKAYEPILIVLDGMVIDVSAVALAKA